MQEAKLRKKPSASLRYKKESKSSEIKNEMISIVFLMLAVFLYVSITKFDGIPEDTRFIGLFGTYIINGLEYLLGQGAIISSFFLLAWALHCGVTKQLWSIRMWGILLISSSNNTP